MVLSVVNPFGQADFEKALSFPYTISFRSFNVDVGLITPPSRSTRLTMIEIGGVGDQIPLIKVMT